jgi:hypothetical protein
MYFYSVIIAGLLNSNYVQLELEIMSCTPPY